MAGSLVLLVDDDEGLREILLMALQQMGHTVHGVENTHLAKKWLAQNRPHLILLDIMMPDGNGLDFCRWVRSQEQISDTPIIIQSALKDEETLHDALEIGATDFLRKPYTMEALQEKIGRLRPKTS